MIVLAVYGRGSRGAAAVVAIVPVLAAAAAEAATVGAEELHAAGLACCCQSHAISTTSLSPTYLGAPSL